MNELIKEFADRSGLAWCIQIENDQVNMQEFAERIILACADIAYNAVADGESPDYAILHKFGIVK